MDNGNASLYCYFKQAKCVFYLLETRNERNPKIPVNQKQCRSTTFIIINSLYRCFHSIYYM